MKETEKVLEKIFSKINEKERDIVSLRFGFGKEKEKSLEEIGEKYKISRERVRQIIEKIIEKTKDVFDPKVLNPLFEEINSQGGAKVEDEIKSEKGKEVVFLLYFDPRFERVKKTKNYFSFWVTNKEVKEKVKKFLSQLEKIFEKEKKTLTLKEIAQIFKEKEGILKEYLKISRVIGEREGVFGLKIWPEISPKTARDKAYLILKKIQKPLHFRELAKLCQIKEERTLHNALIKHDDFVLMGRGIYGLKEWGIYNGTTKDVLIKILKEKRKPLSKEEILEEIKKHKLVKPSTVFAALIRKEFKKNPEGKYTVEEI
jgi:predicted Zn-ribbon and HTH transcriptional regulator